MREATVSFRTTDLQDVRDKAAAFEALFGYAPEITVAGEVNDKGFGNFHLYSEKRIWDVRRKYFTAEVDGETCTQLSPARDYFEDEPTRFFFYPPRN